MQSFKRRQSRPGANCHAGRPASNLSPNPQVVPHEDRWGIYRLKIDTQLVDLLYSSPVAIASLHLNSVGDRFVFSQKVGGDSNEGEEIFTLSTDGNNLRRITDNGFWDLYPVWSPDGSRVAFLSQRTSNLGIYTMNADGSDTKLLYDSSSNEADIDWRDNQIAFTKDNSIWIMQSDGTGIRQITHPPRAGEWGNANLPFGDYDPRISPDGSRVVFERLVGDQSPHGNYDLLIVDTISSNQFRLTQSGYSQGIASWSSAGDRLVYIVAAIGGTGQYDLYMTNADGTGNRNIAPLYFPSQFLCHWAVFSNDDTAIYFIGEWWASE
jgi:Tol biopolymer transport system component